MSENISTRKVRGQCDICGTFGWVLTQYLDGIPVAAQCKTCTKEIRDD